MQLSKPLLLLIFSLLLGACINEPPADKVDKKELLEGRWEIIQALRDEQPTETLSGAYLEFRPGDKMVSNLAGTEEVRYELNDNTITQVEGRNPLSFGIQSISDSLLVLQMDIRGSGFQLTLQKAPATSEE